MDQYDAVVLCGGATQARDLNISGRDLEGVHLAMDFLEPNNKKVAGDEVANFISAKDKHVVVIGGGDTGQIVSELLIDMVQHLLPKLSCCQNHQ